MAKNICCRIQHIQKRIEAQKNGAKYEKALYKLMNNPAFSETMENVINKIGLRLISNKND